jgi:multidrug efflux pump subunit AcrA (membrane-fusion protein)
LFFFKPRLRRSYRPVLFSLRRRLDIQHLRPGRRTPSFIVPADAVIFNQYGLHVAAVQNDTVHMEKITIARELGRQVEVLTGVENGEKVILNPPAYLEDGSKVHVRAIPAAATP